MPYFRPRGKTWSFTVDIGRDPLTNQRKQKTVSGFKSEGAARIACEQFIRDFEQGRRVEHITLEKFTKEYFETEVKHQVTPSTYQTQWQMARDYIFPRLGKQRIDRITHEHVVKFYTSLLNGGCDRGLIRNVAMVLSKTLKAAIVWGYITKSPTLHATVPTYKPKKFNVWTQEQVKSFLSGSKDSWLHHLYVLAFTTGMRIGEMLALTWDDVDLKQRTVSVDKSLKYTSGIGLHVKAPKTENSYRNITLPQKTVAVLSDHRATQPPGLNIVFDNAGERIYPTEAYRTFKRDCGRLGMPPIRLHDARHTHATHLLQKYNVSVVAERLGDTEQTVWQTYSHVLPGTQKGVADHLDEIF